MDTAFVYCGISVQLWFVMMFCWKSTIKERFDSPVGIADLIGKHPCKQPPVPSSSKKARDFDVAFFWRGFGYINVPAPNTGSPIFLLKGQFLAGKLWPISVLYPVSVEPYISWDPRGGPFLLWNLGRWFKQSVCWKLTQKLGKDSSIWTYYVFFELKPPPRNCKLLEN